MRSRLAITAMLMLGLVLGGTGTTLALTNDSGSAAQVQYPQENRTNPVVGTDEEEVPESGVLGDSGSSGESGESAQPAQAQAGEQVVATDSGGSSLPFTGLAAVPLIIVGLGFMAAGAMLYRSARKAPSEA